jgi:hypothetical protein
MDNENKPPPIQIWKLVVREEPTLGERLALVATGVVSGMIGLIAAIILLKTYFSPE